MATFDIAMRELATFDAAFIIIDENAATTGALP